VSPSHPKRTAFPKDPADSPHISEWYGHRVFPVVATGALAAGDQVVGRCPFLSQTVGTEMGCVKNTNSRGGREANSRGVCTISAASNGPRQDWLVCPYRALDSFLLAGMIRRLYGLSEDQPVLIKPASSLSDINTRDEVLYAAGETTVTRAFVYFQDKLGGEIGVSKTLASPQLSFDVTVIELLGQGADLRVGRYGVIELQTTDTHGSYAQAVTALGNALDLHGTGFHAVLQQNPEWAGRKVEGPNISNVFKRTFYQIALKFQLTRRETSVGCVLALPRPVWDSWQPFLGAPELRQQPDGTWRLLDDDEANPSDWIYVFDISESQGAHGGPAPIDVSLVIGTDAATLSRAAFDIAPAKALANADGSDAVVNAIVRRLASYLPGVTS
jgi:hypothetical protein